MVSLPTCCDIANNIDSKYQRKASLLLSQLLVLLNFLDVGEVNPLNVM